MAPVRRLTTVGGVARNDEEVLRPSTTHGGIGKARTDENEPVPSNRNTPAERGPHGPRRYGKCLLDDPSSVRQPHPVRVGVADGQHQTNRSLVTPGERIAFDQCAAQLGLKIHERAFDFDVHELIGPSKNHVCGVQFAWPGGHLELARPGWMQLHEYRPREPQLAGVAEADRGHRVNTQGGLMPDRRSNATADIEADVEIAEFGPADLLLADPGQSSNGCLSQANGQPRDAQLLTKAPRKPSRASTPRTGGPCLEAVHQDR